MADVLHEERVHVVKEVLYPVAGLIEVACVPMVMSVVTAAPETVGALHRAVTKETKAVQDSGLNRMTARLRDVTMPYVVSNRYVVR